MDVWARATVELERFKPGPTLCEKLLLLRVVDDIEAELWWRESGMEVEGGLI